MPNKLTVLKLLWNNLLALKEENKSPDSTYDFLNEDEMITFLFNEDERYIKLLFLTLESGRLDQVKDLDHKFSNLFENFYSKNETTKVAEVKKSPPKKSSPKKSSPKKTVVDKVVEEELEEVMEENETKSGLKVELEEANDSDVEDSNGEDSDVDDEDSDQESDNENDLETFYDEYLLEVDDVKSKVGLDVIMNKYESYCDTNNVEKDTEGLEVFLVNKLGKPKNKRKPKFVGVELKA